MLAWKTQIWEKPRQPSDYKISLCEDYNNGAQRQRPLAPLLRHQAVTTEATTYSSLSLSVHGYALHHTIKFALGYIYTNMTFGLFTNVAPVGSQEYIYIYVPSIRGEVLTGPATSSSSHFPSGGTCFLTNCYKLQQTTTFTKGYKVTL